MSKPPDNRDLIRKGPLLDIYDAVLEKVATCELGASPSRVAFVAVMGIKERLGGQSLYIPMDRDFSLRKRNAEVYAFWEDGNASMQDVALKFDLSQSFVYEIISGFAKQSGLSGKTLQDLRKDRNEKIYSAWKNGAKMPELVQEFGISDSGIRYIIQSTSNQS